MADPRETWQKLQTAIQQQGRRGFGAGGPAGGRAAGGIGALIALGLGGYVLSNSLFNGMLRRLRGILLNTG